MDICSENIKSRVRNQKHTDGLCCSTAGRHACRWLTSGSIESAHSLALSMQPKRAQDRLASIKSRPALGENPPTAPHSKRASTQTAQGGIASERTSRQSFTHRSASATLLSLPVFFPGLSACSLHCRPIGFSNRSWPAVVCRQGHVWFFSNGNVRQGTEIFHI